MRRARHWTVRLLLAAPVLGLLAACSVGVGASTPTPSWTDQPDYGAATDPGGSSPGAAEPVPGGPGNTPSSSPAPGTDPNVVATKLNSPTGLVVLPDGSALVGERATGRIVQVQKQPGQPVTTVRTLTGLSAAGGGGLLDLALSPNFAEDGLIYAYVTTATDNRVLHFTLTGPATPVLTGIPRGASDNTGRIAFGPDGNLYIGTGDAANPATAASPAVLSGKVLRVDDIGQPVPGNIAPGSRVFTTGHRTVDGLCADPASGTVFAVQTAGGGAPDEVDELQAGKNYGWPTPTAADVPPAALLPAAAAGAGGCAVQNSRLYVAARDGKSLQVAALTPGASGGLKIGTFTQALDGRYGRLLTVVAAPDGALWLTTSNKDGHGKPIADDERVLRITAAGGGGNPSV